MSIRIRGARVVVGDGSQTYACADVRTRAGKIVEIGENLPAEPGETLLEADGRVLMPAFIDAHTHALWAGDRCDEFERRLRGQSYTEILKAGGGILSTVRAVRKASEAELLEHLTRRLQTMLDEGTTTVEVKSGYGIDTENELKMLRVIRRAAQDFPGTVVPTALLGHAIDPDQPDCVECVITETLPAIHAEFPDVAVDAYCEDGAWSVSDCRRLFEHARALGHPLRLHVDQFQRLGGLALARELGLTSVDHLESSSASDLAELARTKTFAVVLPASAFHLGGPYAAPRPFLDAGGKLVLASNCNPGSAPTSSMPLVIALGVRHCGLSVAEAIQATTANAAELLGLADRGRIAPGMRADLLLLRHRDERSLAYEFGGNPVDWVLVNGALLREPRNF